MHVFEQLRRPYAQPEESLSIIVTHAPGFHPDSNASKGTEVQPDLGRVRLSCAVRENRPSERRETVVAELPEAVVAGFFRGRDDHQLVAR